MAGTDVVSPVPVRTQTNGDVVAKLVDGTNNAQYLAIDSNGLIGSRTHDGTGILINSQLLGGTNWLQVVTPGTGPSAPGTASTYSMLAGGVYNAAGVTLLDGQQSALQLTSTGKLEVASSTTNDTNYGVVGANTLRTAAQIGNATGAASFNYGAVSAQTLQTASQIGNATGAADFNAGATGAQTLRVSANQGVANPVSGAWPMLITDGTNTAGVTVTGELKVDVTQPLPAGTNLIVGTTIYVGASPASPSNPVPVVITSVLPGNNVTYYNATAAIAVNGTDSTSLYTITPTKTFSIKKVWVSSSAHMRADFQTSPDGITYTTIFTAFVPFGGGNAPFDTDQFSITDAGLGSTVLVVLTNLDRSGNVASGYVTILGVEN